MATYDVFISYSTRDPDKGFVDRLENALTGAGLKVWRDKSEFNPSDLWPSKISEALDQSNYYALVISPNALGSAAVLHEYNAALSKQMSDARKWMLIIKYIPCETPALLKPIQWFDFVGSDLDPAKFQKGIIDIVGYVSDRSDFVVPVTPLPTVLVFKSIVLAAMTGAFPILFVGLCLLMTTLISTVYPMQQKSDLENLYYTVTTLLCLSLPLGVLWSIVAPIPVVFRITNRILSGRITANASAMGCVAWCVAAFLALCVVYIPLITMVSGATSAAQSPGATQSTLKFANTYYDYFVALCTVPALAGTIFLSIISALVAKRAPEKRKILRIEKNS